MWAGWDARVIGPGWGGGCFYGPPPYYLTCSTPRSIWRRAHGAGAALRPARSGDGARHGRGAFGYRGADRRRRLQPLAPGFSDGAADCARRRARRPDGPLAADRVSGL